jgi:hypothetical protein
MKANVVCCPERAELLAAGREFTDQIGEATVIGVAASLAAKCRDGVAGDLGPVDEELRGASVQEDEAGDVDRPEGVLEEWWVETLPERVGGEDVAAAVAHVGGGADRVDDPLHAGADPLLARGSAAAGRRAGGSGEVEEVSALCLIEAKGLGERFENTVGDADQIAALDPRVVLDADAGELGDLAAAQARNTALPVGGYPSLLRRDLRPPGAEELADLGFAVHGSRVALLGKRWESLPVPL